MTKGLEGRIVVFAGPSLPSAVRPVDPALEWRPPAMGGDAVALADAGPRSVVLIDGFFETVPAIRHKELLVLIASGIPVIGGASMGALRAAELHPFGMIGVGKIFGAYLSGRLTGDDEVAVLHGPEDWDWTPLTEALVNVRATILRAVRRRVVPVEVGRAITETAVDIFYKDRTWPRLLDALDDGNIFEPHQSRAFRDWLVTGAVNLKQFDALACIERALAPANRISEERPFPPDTAYSRDLAQQVALGIRRRPGHDALHPGSVP